MVGRAEAGSESLGALGRLLMFGKNLYLIVCVWLCMGVYGCVLVLCVWRVLFINAASCKFQSPSDIFSVDILLDFETRTIMTFVDMRLLLCSCLLAMCEVHVL